MNSRPAIVLGIDFGTKSIGLASGQTLTKTASELTALRYNETRKSKQQLRLNLKKIIDEWRPSAIIIGWPLNMDGSESELCQQVKQFSEQLAKTTDKPIFFIDERLSSHEAKNFTGQKSGFKEKPIDALAAKILLESWLREQA